jgi:hypothetical protein
LLFTDTSTNGLYLLFFGLEISTSNSWERGRGQYNLKIGVGIGRVDNWNFDQLCGKLTISKKVAQSVIFNLLFYTYKSFLGSCLRDCKVKTRLGKVCFDSVRAL